MANFRENAPCSMLLLLATHIAKICPAHLCHQAVLTNMISVWNHILIYIFVEVIKINTFQLVTFGPKLHINKLSKVARMKPLLMTK